VKKKNKKIVIRDSMEKEKAEAVAKTETNTRRKKIMEEMH